MDSIERLIRTLRNSGIKIKLRGDDLEVQFTGTNIPAEIVEQVKRSKKELVAYLSANTSAGSFEHINKTKYQPDYPLSSSQYRLWVLIQTEGSSFAYNMAGAVEISGNINARFFLQALHGLIDRHESLRTVFKENDEGIVRQHIIATDQFKFQPGFIDLKEQTIDDSKLRSLVEQQAKEIFNLETGPLLSMCLYQIAGNRFLFVYNIHHLIGDGWSMEILCRDVIELYRSGVAGRSQSLPALAIQYKDYSAWQQDQLHNGTMEAHRKYWSQKMTGPLPLLDLPSEKIRPVIKTYSGNTISLFIESPVYDSLNSFSREHNASVFMVLLTVVNCVFYKYTQQKDILVGNPVAGRTHADLKDQIGFYVNTLPLRNYVNDQGSFTEMVEQVRETVLDAFKHDAWSLDMLVNDLNIKRDASRSTLFDVLVAFNSVNHLLDNEITNAEFIVKPVAFTSGISRFDLAIKFNELKDGRCQLNIEYNTGVYDEAQIKRFATHILNFIGYALKEPGATINQIQLVDEAEQKTWISDFNNTALTVPLEENIVTLFEKQVRNYPHQLALQCSQATYTYDELNIITNQFANYLLKHHNVQPGDYIGISLERSEWVIISMLAILKAGCSFVPLDLELPEERTSYIKDDSSCTVTIDQNVISNFSSSRNNYSKENIGIVITPLSSAYLIYTSGSTGVPKGVITTHRSVINYNEWFTKRFDITEKDSSILLSSISFSGVYTSVFCTLLMGGALHVVPKVIINNAAVLSEYITTYRVTFLKITPSHLHLLIHYGHFLKTSEGDLRLIVVGGDKIRPHDLEYVINKNRNIQVLYHYGASETTMGSLSYEITKENLAAFVKRPRLGRPISNVQVFILDNNQNLVPAGVTGEICIAGFGLSPGYLNKQELTNQYFIDNPFDKGKKLFRTGDYGRLLEDLTIEFLGRTDNQVKVRGYRVETGEIERALQKGIEMSEIIVLPRPLESGENELVCYFVSEKKHDVTTLRNFLRKKLPEYMIPTSFIQLDKFPVSSTGKLDKSALPSPVHSSLGTGEEYVGPRNEMEEKISAIWKDILNVPGFSVLDSFFEVGGNSLKVTMLVNRFLKEFGTKVSLHEIFSNPSVAGQSALLSETSSGYYRVIEKAPELPDFTLSNSQLRLWALCQLTDASVALNMPVTYELIGDVKPGILQQSIERLAERHEILRTFFIDNADGEPRQRIQSSAMFRLPFTNIDISGLPDKKERARKIISDENLLAFDLKNGPLIRVTLIKTDERKFILSVILHHIVSDGWSMFVLMREMIYIYNNLCKEKEAVLKPLSIQYKDYAYWQQKLLAGGRFEKSRAYWLQTLSGNIPQLNFSSARQRGPIRSFKGDKVNILFSKEQLSNLKQVAFENETTIFNVLFAATFLLMYKNTSQDDLIIGAPFAGRQHVELEDQIGFYVSLLPLRILIDPKDNFISVLSKVKVAVGNAMDNQAYPFDLLLDELTSRGTYKPERNRNPLFDIVVSLLNDHIGSTDDLLLDEIEVRNYQDVGTAVSRFDLMFGFAETRTGLYLTLNYNTDIFDKTFVEQVCVELSGLLDAIIANRMMPAENLIYMTTGIVGSAQPGESSGKQLAHESFYGDDDPLYGFKF